MRLFHFSEERGIKRFIPRPTISSHHTIRDSVVWAVAEEGLWTYLVPRQCPRVTFYATSDSTPQDIETHLCGEMDKKVLAIESSWLEQCLSTTLFRYEFKPDNFYLHDPIAYYYLSQYEETPVDAIEICHPLLELAESGLKSA